MKHLEIEAAFQAIEDITGITKELILSGSREREVINAKSAIMKILSPYQTQKNIAKAVGLKQHSTVGVKLDKVHDWIKSDPEFRMVCERSKERFDQLMMTNEKFNEEIEDVVKRLMMVNEWAITQLNKIKKNYEKHGQANTTEPVPGVHQEAA